MLVEANRKPYDIVICTDGFNHRGSVWLCGRAVHSGAHRITTSGLTMEAEAVTHAKQCLASERDARIAHGITLTDSMSLLQKVESGMSCLDPHSLRLQRLLWIYCPGHARVSGNERADRLASTADISSGLQLGRAEFLMNVVRPKHHRIDHFKKRGWRKEAADISPFGSKISSEKRWSAYEPFPSATMSP